MAHDTFAPTKSLQDLLPNNIERTRYQKAIDEPALVAEASPAPSTMESKKTAFTDQDKETVAKGFSSKLGIVSLNTTEQEEIDENAYMLGKEQVCDPIDIVVLMPLLTEYIQKHWHQHPGLLSVLQQHKPVYNNEDNVVVFSVYNNAQAQLIQQKSDALLKYLRITLNNYQLKLKTTTLAPDNKVLKGPKDTLKNMMSKNPHLEDFMEQLGLELEF